jgi:SnoaL-like protein
MPSGRRCRPRRPDRSKEVLPMAATDTTAALPAAVQELVDKEAIRQVMVDYCRGWDRLDRELVLSCYHREAVDNHGIFSGTPAGLYDAWAAPAQLLANHHLLGQMKIELDGDSARAETYCLATSVADMGDGPEARQHAVRYLDRFEKRDGAWKIASRFVAFDAELQLAGGVPTVPSEENLGRRDGEDRSHALFS